MNEQDFIDEEILEGQTEETPVNDKRRFNNEGERREMNSKEEKSKEPVKSARETELETRLKAETERREAAEAKLVGVQAKFEEIKTQMERETQEMRRRLMKTLEDRAKQEQFNFLTTLLPVLDNLNLAVDASEKDSSFEHLLEGVKGTVRSFEQALISVGVEPIASVGTDFNPEMHEAVDTVAVAPDKDDKITAEYARGYRFGDKLLRPAKVQVGKAKAQSAGE
ncbi:MAG: nucleotide exchange factor GrpE [Acidobacteriota bacterium]|nr:nucleotide exchange factor GrpE [Acidobacteriota bacterium]